MNCREIEYGSPDYDLTIWLRDLVLRKPLGWSFFEDQLAAEYKEHHLICEDDWQLVGCLVMKPVDDNIVKMRQVAVHPDFQRRGIGKLLVEYSEKWSRQNGYSTIELNARETAVPFYLNLNYQKIGDQFEEVGIPHFKMIKQL